MLKNGLLPEGCSKLKSRQQRKPCHMYRQSEKTC